MFINDSKKIKQAKQNNSNDVNVVICTTKMQSIERSVTLIRNV